MTAPILLIAMLFLAPSSVAAADPSMCNGGAGLWPASLNHWMCTGATVVMDGQLTRVGYPPGTDLGALRLTGGGWEVLGGDAVWRPFTLADCGAASRFARYGPGWSYGPGHCQHDECRVYWQETYGTDPSPMEQGDCEHNREMYANVFAGHCRYVGGRQEGNLCRTDGTSCGDGACQAVESKAACPADCSGAPPPPPPPLNPCPVGQACRAECPAVPSCPDCPSCPVPPPCPECPAPPPCPPPPTCPAVPRCWAISGFELERSRKLCEVYTLPKNPHAAACAQYAWLRKHAEVDHVLCEVTR